MPRISIGRPWCQGLLFAVAVALELLLAASLPLGAQQGLSPGQPPPLVITHGPVVESTTPNSAVIAWSTGVSTGTIVRYGTAADHLDLRAEMPWGGYTHRVTLRKLQPGTTYYYQVTSPDAAGSGASVSSDVLHFSTPAGER
jgi:hypothetical protein